MEKRSLTIRDFLKCTVVVFMLLCIPQSARADIQVGTQLSTYFSFETLDSFLGKGKLSIEKVTDSVSSLSDQISFATQEFIDTTVDVTNDVAIEINKNVMDVKSLANDVISNTSQTVTKSSQTATLQVTSQSASVSDSINGVLEKAYGFAIDKTADVLTPFFIEKEMGRVKASISATATKDSNSVSTQTQNVSTNNVNSSSPDGLLQDILRRLYALESRESVINSIQNAPLYQYVTNNYDDGGMSYSIPADTTASTNAIVNSAVSASASSLQQQITALSTSGTATNTFAYIIATSTTATSTFSGNITATAFYGDGSNLTGITSFSTSTTRGVLSSSATGLTYTNSTGDFSLTSGYDIPLTASTTEWANNLATTASLITTTNILTASTTNLSSFWSTPSTRITAGTGLSWTGNTLNSTGVTSIGGLTGVVATSSLGINSSQWITSASDIYYSTGNVGIGTTTPGYALTVAGDISLTGALRANGDAGTAGMILQTTSTGTQWVATSSLGFGSSLSGGVDGYVSRWTGASTLGTGLFMDNGTVAGVNAASSSYTFNVQGSSGINAFNVASSTGTSLFNILANGNVGIGSTTPGSKLTVSGNTFIGGTLTATGTVSVAALITGTVANAPTIDFGSDMSNVLMVSGGTGGRVVGFGNMGGGHMALRVSSGAFIEWSVPNDPRQGVDTAFQRLAAGKIGLGNGTSNDISGTLVLGNLGVGTTTPSAKFAITGNGASTGRAFVIANSSNVDKFVVDDTGATTLATSLTIGTSLARTGQGTFFDGNNFTALGANAGFRSNSGNTTFGNSSDSYLATLRQSYGFFVASTAAIGFTSATSYNGTLDTGFSRISAGVIGVGTGAQGSVAGTLLSGIVGVGTSTPLYRLEVASSTASNYVARITNTGNATGANGLIIQGGENTTGGATFVDFRINNGTSVGSVTQVANTGVLYNTTSDLREKENIVATHYGFNDLMNIKVSDYNFISDSQKRRSTGVIAQELYAIFPEAVSKPADESKSMWAVDYGRITPLIIKSVQELSDIVTTLKTKVEAMFAWFGADGDRFNVKGLVCVDDVCLTKDQFKQLLINTGAVTGGATVPTPVEPNGDTGTSTVSGDMDGGANGDTSNDGAIGDTGTTTPTSGETGTPDPTPEPTPPVVEPAPTPEPVPASEPTSSPTPEPAPVE